MASKFFSAKQGSLTQKEHSRPQTDQLHESAGDSAIQNEADLPPIVARMVVEIRSDGSRTIARGALEDLQTGERVSLQANAKNPIALAQELTKSLLMTPALASTFAKQAARELIPQAIRNKISKKLQFSKRRKHESDPDSKGD